MSDAEWDDLCELIESYNGIEFPRPCDTARLLELLEIRFLIFKWPGLDKLEIHSG